MHREQIKQRIREILSEKILRSPLPRDFDDRSPLLEALGLDSIQELDLLVSLERAFRFSLQEQDVSPELLTSLEALAEFVERKTVGSGP